MTAAKMSVAELEEFLRGEFPQSFGSGDTRIEPAQRHVRFGRGALDDRLGGDHLAGEQVLANAQVLRLRAPEPGCRHLDLSEAAGFRAKL